MHTHLGEYLKGGSGTNKSTQELIRRDRKTVPNSVPPGDFKRGSSDLNVDALTSELRSPSSLTETQTHLLPPTLTTLNNKYCYQYHYYYIDGRIASITICPKSTQSTAGIRVLRPAANGCYLMCKSLPCYLQQLYRER